MHRFDATFAAICFGVLALAALAAYATGRLIAILMGG